MIISSSLYNDNHSDVVVTAITSQIPDNLADDELLLSEEEQNSAGLPKMSKIRVMKIVAIDQRLIRKKIGYVSENTINRVKSLVNRFTG